jgi:hypothetical protein
MLPPKEPTRCSHGPATETEVRASQRNVTAAPSPHAEAHGSKTAAGTSFARSPKHLAYKRTEPHRPATPKRRWPKTSPMAARFRVQRRNASLFRRPPWLPASESSAETPVSSADRRGCPLPNPVPKHRLHPPTAVAARFRSQHRSADPVHRPPWQPASGLSTEAPIPSTDHRGSWPSGPRPKPRSRPPSSQLPASEACAEAPVSSTDRPSCLFLVSAPKRRSRPPTAQRPSFRSLHRSAEPVRRPRDDSRLLQLRHMAVAASGEHRLAMPGCPCSASAAVHPAEHVARVNEPRCRSSPTMSRAP